MIDNESRVATLKPRWQGKSDVDAMCNIFTELNNAKHDSEVNNND